MKTSIILSSIVLGSGLFLFIWLRWRKPFRKAVFHLQDLLQRDAYDFAVFDIRSKDEYSHSHIPGAIHFPLEDIQYLPVEDMFLHIFVYGSSHAHSRKAAAYLSNNGYFNVYNLGRYRNWRDSREQGEGVAIHDFAHAYQNRKKHEAF